jgi:hypothetical protein
MIGAEIMLRNLRPRVLSMIRPLLWTAAGVICFPVFVPLVISTIAGKTDAAEFRQKAKDLIRVVWASYKHDATHPENCL